MNKNGTLNLKIMCGITGILKLNDTKVSEKSLGRFTHSLAHRGPDGAGLYINKEGNLGFGHRRLSILDVSDRGKQPMSYDNGRYWIIYNGEIFNFMEIRNDLIKEGYKFHSDSDTEVILASYQRWGKDCLEKFNGMWGFAIWDAKEKKLFLARDRFGIKPIYFLYIPRTIFAFASETVAFKYLEGFRREVNIQNMASVIHDSFSLEGYGKTIFNHIEEILPGHFMEISFGGVPRQVRWWNTLEHLAEVGNSYDSQVNEFRDIFENACLIRMRSDVPIATALSGGVDSSSVYCMLHSLMKNRNNKERIPRDWQRAFAAVFPGTENDEKIYAEKVAEFTGGVIKYNEPNLKNLPQKVIETTIKFDSIYFSPIIAATNIYESMRTAGVKVSLDGHGVDEMLYGYQPLVENAYFLALSQQNQEYASDILNIYEEMLFPGVKDQTVKNLLEKGRKWKIFIPESVNILKRILRFKLTDSWLRESINHFYRSKRDLVLQFSKNIFRVDFLSYQSFHLTTLPTILRNFDRASMQHGVEVRMPFMDWRLVSYVFSLPMQSKIGHGFAKRILRDAMKTLMPESIRQRKLKIGLNAPMVDWFSGPLREFLTDTMSSKEFLESTVWNGYEIKQFTDKKLKDNSLSYSDCIRIWPYINAHIIMLNNSKDYTFHENN